MALVLTLTVIVLITAMVIEFSYGVYVNTNALYNWQTAQRLSFVAKSAIQLTSTTLSENHKLYPYSYPGIFMMSHPNLFEEFEGVVSSKIEDEDSKFHLNSLVYPNGRLNEKAYLSLIRLLHFLEVNTDLADRIVDWIDPDKESRIEDSEYGAKNGFLDSVDELLIIPGIDQTTFDKLQPYITIYGSGLININGAEIPVLVSLGEAISGEIAERIIHYREITPFENPGDILKVAGFETIGQALMGQITVKGTAFRVTTTATEGDIRRRIESLLEMTGSRPTIKYWKET